MLYLTRGSDEQIPRNAFNSSGGAIDLTGLSIVFRVKENAKASSNIFEKKNSVAGGSDSEIKVIQGNVYKIFIEATDTINLFEQDYYYEIIINDNTNEYNILRIQPPAETP